MGLAVLTTTMVILTTASLVPTLLAVPARLAVSRAFPTALALDVVGLATAT